MSLVLWPLLAEPTTTQLELPWLQWKPPPCTAHATGPGGAGLITQEHKVGAAWEANLGLPVRFPTMT